MVYPCSGYFQDHEVEADRALRVHPPPDDRQDTHV